MMKSDTESVVQGWRACAWAVGASLLVAVELGGGVALAGEPAASGPSSAPAPVSAEGQTALPAETVVFRVQASALPKEAEVVKGKSPDDMVEIVLPGRVYSPPLKLELVAARGQADRRTPEQASASDFSAFRTGDPEWLKENFAPEDYPSIRRIVEDSGVRKQNQRIFMGHTAKAVVATCMYRDHALVFVQYDGAKAGGLVEVYNKAGDVWKRTNALSKDPTVAVLLPMFRSGSVEQLGH